MTDSIATILFLVITAGFFVAMAVLSRRTPSEEARLREWAAQNQFTVLSLELKEPGPFSRELRILRGPQTWHATLQPKDSPPRTAKLWFDAGVSVICEWDA